MLTARLSRSLGRSGEAGRSWICASTSRSGRTASAAEHPHAILHFDGDAVVAHDRPWIAQSTGLALDHEAPQCVAGVLHQLAPLRSRLRIGAVVVPQRRERCFERPAEPAERGRLLLRDLVVERDDARYAGRGPGGAYGHVEIVARYLPGFLAGFLGRFLGTTITDALRRRHHCRCHVTTETPAAASRMHRAPGLKPRRASTSSGVAFGPTSVKTARPPRIATLAARER